MWSTLNKNHDKLQLLRQIYKNYSMNIKSVPTTPQYTVPSNRECVEIQIPVQWGYIRGKWWGPTDKRPILCIHGWQDNCGTFDRLIPYLPQDVGYLAIDTPGHGLSSRIPHGFSYSLFDMVLLLRKLVGIYEWKYLSFLGHSLGGVQSFIYSALFSSEVDFYIGIDIIAPLSRDESNDMQNIYSKRVDDLVRYINMQDIEPRSYTYDQCVDVYVKATNESLNEIAAKILLNRGLTPSIKHSNQYYFSRDARLKVGNMPPFIPEQCYQLAGGIKNPLLMIKATNNPYVTNQEYGTKLLNILKNIGAHQLEFVERAGTHHLHLLQPENIAEDINQFITKYNGQDRSQRLHVIDEMFVKKYH